MAAVLSTAASVRGHVGRFAAVIVLATTFGSAAVAMAQEKDESRFLDLSLLVAPEFPCTWPSWPRFLIHHERIGPLRPDHADILVIDGNTGTQLDVPPHSVPPPHSGLPNAGPFGRTYTDVIPAWQFGGEACVVDCADLLDAAP